MRFHVVAIGLVLVACTSHSDSVPDAGVLEIDAGADSSLVDASVPRDSSLDATGDAAADATADATTDAAITDGGLADASPFDAATSANCGNGVQDGSPWPLFGRCGSRDGVTNVVGAQTNHIAWLLDQTVPFPYQFGSSVIAADGTIYFQNANNGLYAVSSTGAFKWSVGSEASSPPALGTDGTIYFFEGEVLEAVNPDSTSKWTLSIASSGVAPGAPLVGSGGAIYVAASPSTATVGHLTSVTPAGAILWDVETGPTLGVGSVPANASAATPALAGDGTILVNSDALVDGGATVTGRIGAFHPDGSASWTFEAPCPPSAPIVASDGTIRFLCGNESATGNALYALNADGTQEWVLPLSGPAAGLSVGPDGTSYFVNAGLVAVTPSGSIAWTYTAPSAVIADVVPSIGGDGTIYVGASNGFLALNPGGTLKWEANVVTTPSFIGQASIGADGTVYAADFTIYAFGP